MRDFLTGSLHCSLALHLLRTFCLNFLNGRFIEGGSLMWSNCRWRYTTVLYTVLYTVLCTVLFTALYIVQCSAASPQSVLGERVSLSRAGTNVQLTITSLCLKVTGSLLGDCDSVRQCHTVSHSVTQYHTMCPGASDLIHTCWISDHLGPAGHTRVFFGIV